MVALILIGLLVLALAATGVFLSLRYVETLSLRRTDTDTQEPRDPRVVEREVYKKLYGGSRDIEVTEAASEPEPQPRRRAKGGIAAKRPEPSRATQ